MDELGRMTHDLQRSLQTAREVVLWKLDGLGEYDVRRPRPAPTSSGLVKHLAGIEIVYLGETFARPFPDELPWLALDADPTGDLWATAEESRAGVVDLYRRVWAHSDATVGALDLDAPGRVAHWPEARADVTLHGVLLHAVAETHRHAGHADILREAIDGRVGHRPAVDTMAPGDRAWWAAHRACLEDLARAVGGP